jgi:hypothetical protein
MYTINKLHIKQKFQDFKHYYQLLKLIPINNGLCISTIDIIIYMNIQYNNEMCEILSNHNRLMRLIFNEILITEFLSFCYID